MTDFSGAGDKIDFDGNTLLLECEDSDYVYFSRLEIFQFKMDDKIIVYISLMGNNIVPYTLAIGEKYTYFISNHHKIIENDKIEEGTLLNARNDSSDPFDYHLEKCGIDSFRVSEHSEIRTPYPHNDEDDENEDGDLVEEEEENEHLMEANFTNGNNEVVKIFNQNCVFWLERDSVYAFRQCGHKCICEQCYQSKGDFDIIKCVVCRT